MPVLPGPGGGAQDSATDASHRSRRRAGSKAPRSAPSPPAADSSSATLAPSRSQRVTHECLGILAAVRDESRQIEEQRAGGFGLSGAGTSARPVAAQLALQRRDESCIVGPGHGPAQADASQFSLRLGHPGEGRHRHGHALEQVRAALLGLLDALPIRDHRVRRRRRHVGRRRADGGSRACRERFGDISQVEQALLLRQCRVEEHLAEEVPELLGHMGGGGG